MEALARKDEYKKNLSRRAVRPLSLVEKESRYTYADYLSWPEKEGERYELIDGRPYLMASPNWGHQAVCAELLRQIGNYLAGKGKKCRVFYDLDTRPEPREDFSDDTVVRPDIVVVCDRKKLFPDGTGGVNGTPELVVEVLSPSTARHDRVRKFRKYQETGVREYWIVDPAAFSVDVFLLEQGKYGPLKKYGVGKDGLSSRIKPSVFEDCVIDLEPVFAGLRDEPWG